MKRTLITSALLSTLLSTAALADSGNFYAGISAGKSDIDTDVSNLTGTASLDEDDKGFKLSGGYQYNENIAVEVHYTDLGEAELNGNSGDTFVLDGTTFAFTANDVKVTSEGESYGIAAVFSFPLTDAIKPFARIGIQHWEIDGSVTSTAGNADFSDDGTDPFYGVGVDVQLSDSIALRAEYEHYELDSEDAEFLAVGIRVSF